MTVIARAGLRCGITAWLSVAVCASVSWGGQTPAPSKHAHTTETLRPAQRAFLEAKLDETLILLSKHREDASDGLLLAYALFLSGQEEEGRKVFQETMAAPDYQRRNVFLGLLSLLTGKPAAATQYFDTERKASPIDLFAAVMYVETLTLAERFDDAEVAAKQLIEQYPQENIVYHTRGHLESARKSWKAAADAYRQARELGGPNPDLDEGIAAALIELGDLAKARAEIQHCKNAFPRYTEILFQEIRLAMLDPTVPRDRVDALINEYRRRSRRHDRLAELDQMTR